MTGQGRDKAVRTFTVLVRRRLIGSFLFVHFKEQFIVFKLYQEYKL